MSTHQTSMSKGQSKRYRQSKVHSHNESSVIYDEADSMEPAFYAQNYLYQLQSKCNSLEYKQAKNAIYHDSVISQLQSKKQYFEQLVASLSQQNQNLVNERDMLRTTLGQVREQNHSISKEITILKEAMLSFVARSENNLQPPAQVSSQQLQQKEKTINNLQKDLVIVKQSLETKERQCEIIKNEHQRSKRHIRQNQQEYQAERVRLLAKIEKLKDGIKSKDQQIETQVSNQVKRMSEQIQNKDQQLKSLEQERMTLQTKVNQFSLEVGRLKCQKANLEQYNTYLQSNAQQNQMKRKQFQQQIFKHEKQISDLQNQLFNEKLNKKKQLNSLKLQFEQEKIKFSDAVEEKSKEASRLRQQNNYTSRQAIDIEELSLKNQGILTDLDKAQYVINNLKAENQSLKNDLRSSEAKLEKKHEKYCALQTKLKTDNEQRLKALEQQVYNLQEANNELQFKIELSQGKTTQGHRLGQNSQLVELLKMQNKEKSQRIKDLQVKERQWQEVKRNFEDQVGKLQGDIRMSRELKSIPNKQERVGTIQLLQREVNNLNQELSQLRRIYDLKKNEWNEFNQKYQKQVRYLQTDKQRLSKKNEQLQNLIRSKQQQFGELQQQLVDFKTSMNYNAQQIQQASQLKKRVMDLEKSNMRLKVDYSQSLQQTNSLLQKYQELEDKYKKLKEEYQRIIKQSKQEKIGSDPRQDSNRSLQLEHQCQRLRQVINSQEYEQRRLLKTITQLKQPQTHSHMRPSNEPTSSKRHTEQLWLNQDPKTTQDQRQKGLPSYRSANHYYI